jgi:predicted amidohydrolase YtcJ
VGVSTTSVAADLILLNGNVLTIDPFRPRAQAVAIGGTRIPALGSNKDVRGWASPGVVVRDLARQTLLPGFYDSHNHMLLTGFNLAAVDLSGTKSVADVVRVMGERAASASPGQWVLSSARWHESQLAEARFPLREELDCVSEGHPLLLQRGGHNVLANSQALELAGIEPDVPNPPGGTFVRGADGTLTGHAIGAAAQLIRARMPDPPERLLHEALLRVSAPTTRPASRASSTPVSAHARSGRTAT